MSAEPIPAHLLCQRCGRSVAVWRHLCLACRDVVNPSAAVQDRFLMLLRDLSRREMIEPGTRYEFVCQFQRLPASMDIEMYDATLRTQLGDLAFRQKYGIGGESGGEVERLVPRWKQAFRVLLGR